MPAARWARGEKDSKGEGAAAGGGGFVGVISLPADGDKGPGGVGEAPFPGRGDRRLWFVFTNDPVPSNVCVS